MVVCGAPIGLGLTVTAHTPSSWDGTAVPEPALKRPLDLLAAGLGLLALGPVLAGIAAAIKLDSPGPVLYRATRTGRFGQPFTMYKFRTMQTRQDHTATRITTHGDRRITRVGRLLRSARLDELPQLWNVLTGDMSLVGPRPEDPRYTALYTGADRRALAVRPGITSLAALLYRDEDRLLVGADWERVYVGEVMPAKLAIDNAYVERQSVWLDVKILLATALAPLRLEGFIDLKGEVERLRGRQPVRQTGQEPATA
ncbi:MAG: sugar transferase [Chloroflexi bacterium]|nr:sugar transferase [Chloroflexota bacterium]